MMTTLALIIPPLLFSTTVSQFHLKPDMSFGDGNDRFDISNIMHQNRQRRERPEEDYDYRRSGRQMDDVDEKELQILEQQFNDLVKRYEQGQVPAESGRRDVSDTNFAYHDNMYSKEGDGGLTDFENNLKQFKREKPVDIDFRRAQEHIDKLHGGKTRRAGDPEKEILMHYAVPIRMNVKGYLQAPLMKQ